MLSLKYKIIIFFICFFCSLFLFGFFNFLIKHEAKADLNNEYFLDVDYAKVKNILMKSDILEEIVEAEHGELVSKEWSNLTVSFNKIFKNGIDLEGDLEFVVSKKDENLGDVILKFKQKINISKFNCIFKTSLKEPCGYLKNIKTQIQIVPFNQDKTKIITNVNIDYERIIPKYMIEYVDEKVNNAAKKILENNQKIITEKIKKYYNKKLINIPLFD